VETRLCAAEGLAEGGEAFGDDAPPGPFPPFAALDEACLGEDAGVVGDGGLALAEGFGEVAAAYLALSGQDGQKAQAYRAGQGGQD
jgi:hypothetical protein